VPEADFDEWQPPAIAKPALAGMAACAPCHANRVAEFQKTRHAQACRIPDATNMPAGFLPGQGTFTTRDPALRFEMTQHGGQLFQTAIHSRDGVETRTPARIAFAYGSGGILDEVYFTWHAGNRLYELPVAWLHAQRRFAMTTYNPYGEGDHARDTTERCVECHNTWLEHVPGTRNQYNPDGALLGVTCERCHGPGRDHVAYHEAHPNDDAARAIVHPGKLPRERQIEVCAQCHSNAIHPRTQAFQYRPGEALDRYFKTIDTRFPEFDHVANQTAYLRQSKCFQKSTELTCTTCHNPHRPHEPNQRGSSERSCFKCHQRTDCAEVPRLPAAIRDNCIGCHMPARVWMNVHFHTEDDQYVPPIRRYQHRIAIDPVARQEVLLAWYRTQSDPHSHKEAARLEQTVSDYWLDEAAKRESQYRLLAAIGALREALHVHPTAATRAKLQAATAAQAQLDADFTRGLHEVDERRFADAIGTLGSVLARKPNFARAHGKLGSAYAATGKREDAVKHLQAVAAHDPNDPYGLMMLAWLDYLDGNARDAVASYRRADEIEPCNVKTHYHWGLALVQLGQLTDAADHFRQALTIDPDHAGACQGLSHVLRRQGQAEEAVRFARRAVRLTGERNADILVSLADAYADAGRIQLAIAAAGKALDAAKIDSPQLVTGIRSRLTAPKAR
jgi:tetratricopeptide (TPR) repeat protein